MDLVDQVERVGYYGGVRLLKATLKRFAARCRTHGIHLRDGNFNLRYR